MDAVSPPNIPDDPPAAPTGAPELRWPPGCRSPPAPASFHTYDSIGVLSAGPAMGVASIHSDRPVTNGDAVQTAHRAYDTDSTQTAHRAYDTDSTQTAHRAYDTDSTQTARLTCDTDSERTLNPPYDTDSTRALHSTGGDDVPASLCNEPPPYSPPDPKLAYLIYPPTLPHYANQPVIACQPAAGPPTFYQPSFMPTSAYPSYAIYVNGPPIVEEQPPLPKNYLVESLLVTIFCCLMSGLVAVMYSFETRAALARGDTREGERASQKARVLVMFSLMFGIFVFVGWIIYVIIALCI